MAMPSQNGPGYSSAAAKAVASRIYGMDGEWSPHAPGQSPHSPTVEGAVVSACMQGRSKAPGQSPPSPTVEGAVVGACMQGRSKAPGQSPPSPTVEGAVVSACMQGRSKAPGQSPPSPTVEPLAPLHLEGGVTAACDGVTAALTGVTAALTGVTAALTGVTAARHEAAYRLITNHQRIVRFASRGASEP